ncbi:MAG: hypothetical protein EAZ52_06680 [Alphaproteobacteria bacterium]|nr:MAG: hypothetical protein EAZ52_06680 [Alphaproteobacteria bacterium]
MFTKVLSDLQNLSDLTKNSWLVLDAEHTIETISSKALCGYEIGQRDFVKMRTIIGEQSLVLKRICLNDDERWLLTDELRSSNIDYVALPSYSFSFEAGKQVRTGTAFYANIQFATTLNAIDIRRNADELSENLLALYQEHCD